jgi:hypothetical protein
MRLHRPGIIIDSRSSVTGAAPGRPSAEGFPREQAQQAAWNCGWNSSLIRLLSTSVPGWASRLARFCVCVLSTVYQESSEGELLGRSETFKIVIYVEIHPQKSENRLADYHL